MAIPKRVQDAADAADQVLRDQGQPPAAPQGDQGNTPAEPPAAPAEPPQEPAPAAPPAEPPAPPPPNDPTLEQRLASLEQAHRVLTGKYNAETARATVRIRELEAENGDLRGELEQLRGSPAPAATAGTPEDLLRFVPKERVDEFGQPLMAAQAETADRVATARLQPVLERLAAQERRAFYSLLDAKVPKWQEINQEGTGFFDWLAERQPMTPYTRQQLLTGAFERMDADACAEFFLAFLQSKAPPAPAAQPPAGQQKPTPKPPPLSSLAAPRRGPAGAPPTEPRVWKTSEIKAAVADITKGRIRGDEARRITQEIDNATREGRIAVG